MRLPLLEDIRSGYFPRVPPRSTELGDRHPRLVAPWPVGAGWSHAYRLRDGIVEPRLTALRFATPDPDPPQMASRSDRASPYSPNRCAGSALQILGDPRHKNAIPSWMPPRWPWVGTYVRGIEVKWTQGLIRKSAWGDGLGNSRCVGYPPAMEGHLPPVADATRRAPCARRSRW